MTQTQGNKTEASLLLISVCMERRVYISISYIKVSLHKRFAHNFRFRHNLQDYTSIYVCKEGKIVMAGLVDKSQFRVEAMTIHRNHSRRDCGTNNTDG